MADSFPHPNLIFTVSDKEPIGKVACPFKLVSALLSLIFFLNILHNFIFVFLAKEKSKYFVKSVAKRNVRAQILDLNEPACLIIFKSVPISCL